MEYLLNKLIGTAMTDRGFGALLLADPRGAAISFGLGAEELEIVAGIRANTLWEFAQRLEEWMVSQHGENGRGGNGNGRGKKAIEQWCYWPESTCGVPGRLMTTAVLRS